MSRRAPLTLAALLCLLVAAVARAATPGAQPLVQVNVSNDSGIQAEVAVTIDPSNDRILLAGSNSMALTALGSLARVYSSIDGGATWASAPGPPAAPLDAKRKCTFGDPAVAIDRSGRQYYAFLSATCISDMLRQEREADVAPSLQVASRSGPHAAWHPVRVFPTRKPRFDDKPALAVDTSPKSPHVDRVYAVWSRISRRSGDTPWRAAVVLSRSDDGGTSWSRPVVVSDGADAGFAAIAVDRDGTVFVSWIDERRGIWIDRSTDGGEHFGRDVRIDRAIGLPTGSCTDEGEMGTPAQAKRCITPTPLVSLDDRLDVPERVYVTYGAPGGDGREQDVFVAAVDASLQPLLGTPAGAAQQVNPPDGTVLSDQFMPTAAFDRSTGLLWACFYDTAGDRRRERVFYSCTASADGGKTWARPVRAADVASKEAGPRGGLAGFLSEFQFGDYQGLAVANGVAHPMWTDTRDLDTLSEEIYTTVLTAAQLQLP